ncbi:cell surface glycoprotein CD200 receptor 5-like isoform X2 [Marmota marmota marmota]|uniref:cell surface glycoprotein CD200 receptor 5-like isoform X2 n=1 Tax=Marmota marmota marmota TaxID=9994 RepID=UPI0007625A4A|nr:cell surface glycoprotein CD200 receptor 5-like isoform X2 [Marmota marmota marmota]XP_048659268.1 cell surface glycoprotein CD200 receptor 5-like isoform X2 [Marmota marmota marmota]
MHTLKSTLALRLLTSIIIMVPDSISSCLEGNQTTLSPVEDNTWLAVQMGTKAVLCCPCIPPSVLILTSWKIHLRDKPLCTISLNRETNETGKNNCTDGRISWASRPDQNPELQIHPVSMSHEGDYRCEMGTTDGNFERTYHLQVLVPPEVTLSLGKNRTVECRAIAGRPAAQIFWAPEGDCVTGKEYQDNGTVTTRSRCHYPDGNVSTVTCLVSHLTGNRSQSIDLLPDSSSSCLDGQQMALPPMEVTTSLSVQMGTKVVLYCPCIPLTRVLITTWRIRFRNKPSCKIAHDRETNQTIETNCVDRRITWASRPDQSPHLQIYATAITHDGYFRCQMATYHGNFRREYHLQVLGLGTPESPGSTLLIILYAKLSLLVVILVMVGFAFFQRINDCRE